MKLIETWRQRDRDLHYPIRDADTLHPMNFGPSINNKEVPHRIK
jgi:hypothetical protein